MAKELPYFQFEPAEYLTKDVSLCSLEAQGLFINIAAFYWQRCCKLTKTQVLRRFNYPNIFKELLDEEIIKVEGENISIEFLNIQFEKITEKNRVNKENGKKGGRPRKPKENPTVNQMETERVTEIKPIREDKIREDNKRENTREEIFKTKQDFFDWFNKMRTQHTGLPSNFNIMSYDDQRNLNTLKQHKTMQDFEIAFKTMCKNKWVKDNKMSTISHFLKPESFEKYLNGGIQSGGEVPLKTLSEIAKQV